MRRDKYKAMFAVMLVLSDALTTMAAFVLAYYIRREIPWPNPPQNMAPLRSYAGMLMIQTASILIVFSFTGSTINVGPYRAWTNSTPSLARSLSAR